MVAVINSLIEIDDQGDSELGKVVVLLSGQPDGVDAAAWKRASSPQVRGMNIFGRGAAAMIVGNAGSSAQPFATIANYLSRRRVSLASAPPPMFQIPSSISSSPTYSPMHVVETLTHPLFQRMPPLALT